MIGALLTARMLIAGSAALAFSLDGRWGLSLMFFGFALVDAGAFWVSIR